MTNCLYCGEADPGEEHLCDQLRRLREMPDESSTLLSYHGINKVVGILFTGVDTVDKLEDLIDDLFQMTVTTGCGKKHTYTPCGFPREDRKCDCGKDNCWVVKYE